GFKFVSCSCNFFKNIFQPGCPDERFRIGVPGSQEELNRFLQAGDAEEYSAPQGFLRQRSEPSFDEVQPTGTAGSEMRNKASMLLQPGWRLRRHVAAV